MNWIRDKWPHEAKDFTPWLASNLDLISSATDLNLHELGQEVPAGAGRVDILAYDTISKSKVVIENQLTAANARHFQQLIAYGDTLQARIRIWIATSFHNKFIRLILDQNKKSSFPNGPIYFCLKIRRKSIRCGAVVFVPVSKPIPHQVSQASSQNDSIVSTMLANEFWEYFQRQTNRRFFKRTHTTSWKVNKYETVFMSRHIHAHEAKIRVFIQGGIRSYERLYQGNKTASDGSQVLSSKTPKRDKIYIQRIRFINAYSKQIQKFFPQASNQILDFDKAIIVLFEAAMPIDLQQVNQWQQIIHWFLTIERKIRNIEPSLTHS